MIETPDYVPGSHCSYCGHRFPEQKIWPRKCFFCYNDSYKNPLPVAVALLPVVIPACSIDPGTGILVGKRCQPPGKDQWGLIGGYMEAGESYREAVSREVQEEIGLITNPSDWTLFECKTTSEHLLLFCSWHGAAAAINISAIPFVPNHEVGEITITYGELPLAFPTHTAAVNEFMPYLDPNCP